MSITVFGSFRVISSGWKKPRKGHDGKLRTLFFCLVCVIQSVLTLRNLNLTKSELLLLIVVQ